MYMVRNVFIVSETVHIFQVLIKALHVRPDLTLPTQECSLKVSLQPLRLNIDQVGIRVVIAIIKNIFLPPKMYVGPMH